MRQMLRATLLTALALIAAVTPAFAQAGGGGFRGGFGGGFGLGGLVQIPEVQKELKLDDTQVDLLKALRENRPNFQEFQSLSPEERQKKFTEFRQQTDKKIAEILDAKQLARAKQLEIQQAGPRALAQSDVATKLKLTAPQQTKIQTILQGERDSMRQVFESFRNNGGGQPSDEDRQKMFQKFQEARQAIDKQLLGVLTEDQKGQFDQLKGAPFTFPRPQFGRRPNNNN